MKIILIIVSSIFVISYIFNTLEKCKLFDKFGYYTWKAFIPIYNHVILFEILKYADEVENEKIKTTLDEKKSNEDKENQDVTFDFNNISNESNININNNELESENSNITYDFNNQENYSDIQTTKINKEDELPVNLFEDLFNRINNDQNDEQEESSNKKE